MIHLRGRLSQKFVVDLWASYEQSVLESATELSSSHNISETAKRAAQKRADVDYKKAARRAWFNRDRFKLYQFKEVADSIATDVDISDKGLFVYLPPSHIGSRRATRECYQDSIAVVRRCGEPSLFIASVTTLAVKLRGQEPSPVRGELEPKKLFHRESTDAGGQPGEDNVAAT